MYDFFEEKKSNRLIISISIILVVLLLTISFLLYKKITTPKIFSVSLEQNQQSLIVGETIKLSAKPSISKQLRSIDFYIDTIKISSCTSVSKCEISYITQPNDIGTHTASFVLTDTAGNTYTKSTTYTVHSDTPEIFSLNTNEQSLLTSGDYFYASVIATSTSPISSIDLYIDGSVATQCSSSPCTALIGPFQNQDQGSHMYTYVVTNDLGKSTSPGGTFEVQPTPTTPSNNAAPTISPIQISSTTNEPDQPITLSVATADDETVTSIIITIDKKEIIAICDNTTTCTTITAIQTPGTHTYEVTVIDNKGKQTKATGEITITEPIKKETPPSNTPTDPPTSKASDTESPSQDTPTKATIPIPEIIYIISSGDTLVVGQSLTATVVAKDAKAITSIIGYIDTTPQKTCTNVPICSFTFGPITKESVGSHTYSFVVTNSDKQSITKKLPFTVEIATPTIIPSDSPIQFFDTQSETTGGISTNTFVPVDTTITNPNDIENINQSAPTQSPLWIDTDGGINITVAGKCLSNVPNARYQKFLPDTCLDAKTLKEYYVDASASSCLSKIITCSGACYEGLCFHAAPQYTKPTETSPEPHAAPQYTKPTETSPEPHAAPQYTPPTETSPEPHDAPQYTKPTETSPTWTDSDGGYAITTFGICSISDGSSRPKSDYCIDEKTLLEVYLSRDSTSCIEQTVTCEGSCYQGYCYVRQTR